MGPAGVGRWGDRWLGTDCRAFPSTIWVRAGDATALLIRRPYGPKVVGFIAVERTNIEFRYRIPICRPCGLVLAWWRSWTVPHDSERIAPRWGVALLGGAIEARAPREPVWLDGAIGRAGERPWRANAPTPTLVDPSSTAPPTPPTIQHSAAQAAGSRSAVSGVAALLAMLVMVAMFVLLAMLVGMYRPRPTTTISPRFTMSAMSQRMVS